MNITKIGIGLSGLIAVCQVPGACSVYDESLLGGNAGTAGDASSGVCQSVTWPKKPTGDVQGEGNDFVAALTTFDFGEPYEGGDPAHAVWRDIGYDIDSTCTAQGASDIGLNPDRSMKDSSSCEPPEVPGFPPRVGDLPGGVDNNLRLLIELVQGVLPQFGTPAYNANIRTGRASLLIGISGYNGEPNDDQVTMTLYSPAEFKSVPENTENPKFDGSDRWPVSKDSFDPPGDTGNPKFVSSSGFVRDNVVVAAVRNLDLPLRIGISSQDVSLLQIKFVDPFLTARIGRNPQSNLWELKAGKIVARWKADDLFDMLSRFPNPDVYPDPPGPGENPYFCASSGYYTLIRNFICYTSDIYSGGQSAAAPCDSLSVGIGFEAVEARIGSIVDPAPTPPNPCGAADPAQDSCDRVARGLPAPGVGTGDGG